MIGMQETSSGRQALAWSLLMAAVALGAGAALGLAPPALVLLGLAVLAPLPFILNDYRVGVVLLALVLLLLKKHLY